MRWLAVFTLLLLVSSAVPVLAEPPAGSDAEGMGALPPAGPTDAVYSLPAEQIPGLVPTAEELRAASELIEREEAERRQDLRSADSKRERVESRFAFASSSDVQTKELLDTLFTDEFARLNADPARELSDARIVKDYGEHGALVESEGETRLMEGNFPRRAEDDDGELRKVDLGLRGTGDGFEPENPLTELAIPATSGGEIEVGDDGIAIVPLAGNANRPAQLYGDQNVLYTDVDTDTDRIASPTSGGVELFDLLRSADSPEVLRYGLLLPQGAVLRPNDRGGAEVLQGEEVLLTVSPPRAVDAQGSEVPVSLNVQKEAVELSVPHRTKDFAYPILVDPLYEEFSWYWGYDESALWAWNHTATNYGLFNQGRTCLSEELCPPHPKLGLFVTSEPGSYWAWDHLHWTYAAPNMDSYVENVELNPFWRKNHGGSNCTKAKHPQPHDYAGLWGNGGWNALVTNAAETPGSAFLSNWGYSVNVGLGTAHSAVEMPCWRSIMLGGAIIHLNDWGNPNLANPTGVPSGWIKSSEWHSIGVSANDSGLGVKSIQVENQTGVKIPLPNHYCTGQVDNRCPTSLSGSIPLNAGYFAEGKGTASIVAHDALEKSSVKRSFDVRVDSTGPKIDLEGQLAVITEEDEGPKAGDDVVETLSSSVYKLKIKTEDGSNSSEEKMRSGVKNIEIYLDEKQTPEPVDWEPNPSPCQSCPKEGTYLLKLADLDPVEKHTLKVVAIDQIKNKNDRTISFKYIPATGMKDEYVMHYFPLDDGEGNEAEEENPERPELAVNIMSGNLVYREQDIDVEGSAVDLEVERYYNSLLPEQQNSELGDGWTLGETPELEAEEGEGTLMEGDGALAGSVPLPSQVGGEKFSSRLRAMVTKLPSGRYEVKDETGESSTAPVFEDSGKLDELRTEGLAKVDYAYESGDLAEIAVDDPASTNLTPEEAAAAESERYGPTHLDSFGSYGPGDDQFKTPGGIARNSEGDLWITDVYNHRLKKTDPEGELLDTILAPEGKTMVPSSIAVDDEDNVWITDSARHVVEAFEPDGDFIRRFGNGYGSAPNQFAHPEGIAFDSEGDLWIAEAGNARLREFTPQGEPIRTIATQGSEPHQLKGPKGLAIGPDDKIWVADSPANQVKVYDQQGDFIRAFGSKGTGPGQFDYAVTIDVDQDGNAWVTDIGNGRVQQFDSEGTYIRSFGSKGFGEGQFSFTWPSGILSDGEGVIWVVDGHNNRVQRWFSGYRQIPNELPPAQDDPQVDVEVTGGLVETIEGEEAGELTYEHDGDLLTSVEGPDGETSYEYDGQGRMTRVELANGTWAEIEYEKDTARVASVEVDSDGPGPKSAKTTYFTYSEEPTRTYVDAPDVPVVVYDIGLDGSIFQWEYLASPPDFENISGSLWVQKETLVNKGDHNLVVLAESPHGIASIEVIANGDQLLEEETCVEPPNTPQVVECEEEELQWVTSTSSLTPGILNLEMVITDQHGRVASQRFWVDIPHTPPPPPGVPQPPNYAEIKQFREEFGLDIDIKNQPSSVRNNRIWRLLYDWGTGDPVARASREKWGVPLRPVDVAEMEYREWYIQVNAGLIQDWANDNAASTYGGYNVDHRNGGTFLVGFKGNQEASLDQLMQAVNLAAPERIETYPAPVSHSYASLVSLQGAITEMGATGGALAGDIARVGVAPNLNRVEVGASNPGHVSTVLSQTFGGNAGIHVYHEPREPLGLASRFTDQGRIQAGHAVGFWDSDQNRKFWCTAGFGAAEKLGDRSNGQPKVAKFVLTAGHCFPKHFTVGRFKNENDNKPVETGVVARRAWGIDQDGFETDAEAVRLNDPDDAPRKIYTGGEPVPVTGVVEATPRMHVCVSGVTTDRKLCGFIKEMDMLPGKPETGVGPFWLIIFNKPLLEGDSGGPVWTPGGKAVGMVQNIYGGVTPLITPRISGDDAFDVYPPPIPSRVPGVLNAPDMGPNLYLLKAESN